MATYRTETTIAKELHTAVVTHLMDVSLNAATALERMRTNIGRTYQTKRGAEAARNRYEGAFVIAQASYETARGRAAAKATA